eukprot:scaffold87565_cov31-Tisochrysis_lutea.AAC.4
MSAHTTLILRPQLTAASSGKRAQRHLLSAHTGDISKLEVERLGEVSGPAESGLGGDDAKRGEHRNAAVLDLELDVAAVIAARVGDRLSEEVER